MLPIYLVTTLQHNNCLLLCLLLYLHCLIFLQIDSDQDGSSVKDPDTPQQKYYTIMIERIPPHLRSAEALYNFFNHLFPGEVRM